MLDSDVAVDRVVHELFAAIKDDVAFAPRQASSDAQRTASKRTEGTGASPNNRKLRPGHRNIP